MALLNEVRLAARSLRRNPGFTLLVCVTLGLGIAVNNTFFTVIHVAALRGLPLQDPERMIHVATQTDAAMLQGVSYADFRELQNASRGLVTLAAAAQSQVALGDVEHAAERVTAAFVTADGLRVFGNRAQIGRLFAADDERDGAEPVAVLSDDVWRTRYSANPDMIGSTIRVDGVAVTVIGVLQQRYVYTGNAGVWLPLAHMPSLRREARDARTLNAFGRLGDGVDVTAARPQLEAQLGSILAAHPEAGTGMRAVVVPLNERYTQRIIGSVWPTFIAAGLLVLLIACANVANLLLTQSVRRVGEVAIRTALGASRTRVVRQLLIESVLLALVGGTLGVALSFGGLRALQSMIPAGSLPYWFVFSTSPRVLGVILLLSLGTAVLFGLVPALYTSRFNVQPLLKASGRGSVDAVRARRWTTGFLSVQLGLAFILLAMTSLSVRRERVYERLETPLQRSNVLTTRLTLPAAKYPTPDARADFYDRLVASVAAQPNVAAVALASALPYSQPPLQAVEIEGRTTANANAPTVRTASVTSRYFASLGLGALRGRDFSASVREMTTRAPEAIVNTRFAEIYFPGRDAIGQRIRLRPVAGRPQAAGPWLTIVGVSPAIEGERVGPEPEPVVYSTFAAGPGASLLVRGRGDTALGVTALSQQIARLDLDVPMSGTLSLDDAIRNATWNARASSSIVTTITLISALLALIGLYAVSAHAVDQRKRELSLRTALGARPRDLGWLVLRRGLVHIVFGTITGIGLTAAWERFFDNSYALGMHLADPTTIAVTFAVLVVVGTLACLRPAHRAIRIDPIQALRAE